MIFQKRKFKRQLVSDEMFSVHTWRLDRELQLVVELCQEQVVAQGLSHLHDPEN